jgi:hypothetical protein
MTRRPGDERHQKVKELFLEACRRDASERAAYLDEVCGQDKQLRREVQSLLAHHQPGSSFLDPVMDPGVLAGATVLMRSPNQAGDSTFIRGSSQASTTQLDDPPDVPAFEPGAIINDRYRVTGLLGRGGMGDVYRAARTVPQRSAHGATDQPSARLPRLRCGLLQRGETRIAHGRQFRRRRHIQGAAGRFRFDGERLGAGQRRHDLGGGRRPSRGRR